MHRPWQGEVVASTFLCNQACIRHVGRIQIKRKLRNSTLINVSSNRIQVREQMFKCLSIKFTFLGLHHTFFHVVYQVTQAMFARHSGAAFKRMQSTLQGIRMLERFGGDAPSTQFLAYQWQQFFHFLLGTLR